MAEKLEIKCDNCRKPIVGDRLSYNEHGSRYHPLVETVDNLRAPNCVWAEELERFRVTAGNLFEGTIEEYATRFSDVFPNLYAKIHGLKSEK